MADGAVKGGRLVEGPLERGDDGCIWPRPRLDAGHPQNFPYKRVLHEEQGVLVTPVLWRPLCIAS